MNKNQIKTVSKVFLFIDLHNYSIAFIQLGEKHAEFIQDYYILCGDIISYHGGEIFNFTGDSIFSSFFPEKVTAAVESAFEIKESFKKLTGRYKIEGLTEIETGIGSGDVVTGVFGHRNFRKKDYFGIPLIHTSKIMHHRGIAVTWEIYEKLKENKTYRFIPLSPIKLKWQSESLEYWSVQKKEEV
ncbi:MAG: hypothetical protein A2Y33_10335 [Spirochaetes bacterium GWF1_51_8]|nr:MAG: hypothetical protein A2Y33_10335 [Spirochaetes bacterium GWF1_51_8]